ncbi:hypothetical protein A9Q99_00720 [Gammaproteobacteria bacterium 45_16_T64]|nr:hypothetical protein A9Q99_00720 [Gammaproteobacteria bacterium 45_16_T64]
MENTPTALVTGGGSGIGKEICKRFYKAGYNLVVVSLLTEELEALEKELKGFGSTTSQQIVHTLALDLTRDDATKKIFELCDSNNITITTLINNAGFGLHGRHIDLDPDQLKSMLLLNIIAVSSLCHEMANRMSSGQHKNGPSNAIINIGSTSAFQPLPKLAAYAASKAFIVSFTEALAEELRNENIEVHCICPGTTNTKFLDVAGLKDTTRFGSTAYIAHKIAMSPTDVAEVTFNAIDKKQVTSTPGIINNLHHTLTNWLPKSIVKPVANLIFNR